jgi:two-component system response regulator YesN
LYTEGTAVPYTILLVDDDPDFRDQLKDLLDDYTVVEAKNGEEALALLKAPNAVDLVMLDVMMPGIKGTEVLRLMKADNPALSIVISTAHSSKDVAIAALRSHADDYLEKPFQAKKAKAVVGRLLEGKLTTDVSKSVIEKVKEYTERNCEKNVSLEDVAAVVGLSPKYLSRLFKTSAGCGFSRYKIGLRMEMAVKLLTTTQYNINQIASRFGYLNTESFIRTFKKITGCTPAEYRSRL